MTEPTAIEARRESNANRAAETLREGGPGVQPERIQVTRWRCPHCGRSRANRADAARHMARCWYNPAARACKTCAHYEIDESEPDVGYVGQGDVCNQKLNDEYIDLRPGLVNGCPFWEAS